MPSRRRSPGLTGTISQRPPAYSRDQGRRPARLRDGPGRARRSRSPTTRGHDLRADARRLGRHGPGSADRGRSMSRVPPARTCARSPAISASSSVGPPISARCAARARAVRRSRRALAGRHPGGRECRCRRADGPAAPDRRRSRPLPGCAAHRAGARRGVAGPGVRPAAGYEPGAERYRLRAPAASSRRWPWSSTTDASHRTRCWCPPSERPGRRLMDVVVAGVDALRPEHGPLFAVIGVFDGLHRGHAYLLRASRPRGPRTVCSTHRDHVRPSPGRGAHRLGAAAADRP